MNGFKEEGRQEGIIKGRQEGIIEGKISIMIGLVKDKLLSVHEAAARLNMDEQDLQKRINEGIKA